MKAKVSFNLLLFLLGLIALIGFGLDIYFNKSARREINNVLLISIDTCRADYLGCYGSPLKSTPNIDKLAEKSFLITHAYSVAPITLPAHCSMLTGMIPPVHGVHDNNFYKLDESAITLAEIMGENGYTTAGFVSAFVLDSEFGLNQGFDFYDDTLEKKGGTISVNERNGEATTRSALKWLEQHKQDNFFIFLHYYDPHLPYSPPEPFVHEFKNMPYAGEIAYVDQCIGQVIKELKESGRYESTMILVTADHGEMLGEHGENSHVYFVYQSAVRVPLIVKLPHQHAGQKIDRPVSLIDIVPTVCRMMKLKTPATVQGKDISEYFHTKDISSGERLLYCESLYPTRYNANALYGIITKRWKYIQTTRPELYDIVEDFRETENLLTKKPQRAQLLQNRLKEILEGSKSSHAIKSERNHTFSQDALNRLESLGYVGGSGVKENYDFDQARDDPKDLISFHELAMKAFGLLQKRKYNEAQTQCEKMLMVRPGDFTAYSLLARIALEKDDISAAENYLFEISNHYTDENTSVLLKILVSDIHANIGQISMKKGRLEDALARFAKALHMNPNHINALYSMGLVFEKQVKYKAAEEKYLKVLHIKPDHHKALYNLGVILYRQRRFSESAENFFKALQLKPDNMQARFNLGVTLLSQEKYDEAIMHFEKVLQTDPTYKEIHNNLGKALFAKGSMKKAILHFQTEITIDPGNAQAHDNLGTALAKEGRINEAIVHFKRALGIDPARKETEKKLKAALALLKKWGE